MNDSMAQATATQMAFEAPAWRRIAGWSAAILLSLLFLASGLWKITDAEGAAVRMAQARVPEALSLAAALAFGIVETTAGVMLLTPRLRRWGAILSALLLLSFLVWFGIHYNALRGEECSCFPWLKRVVDPGFFIGDGLMLALAAVAGVLSLRPSGARLAALVTGAITIFAFVSWGVATVRQTGTRAPSSVIVDGQPYSLGQGKVLLFFFDPECMHCFDAAQRMSKLDWGSTRVVGVPITHPQYAPQFITDTGMKMPITSDHAKLKQIFPYTAVPTAIALQNGRELAPLVRFEADEPAATLKRLGMTR
jgi:uncharacterized membrane protein YphA (DoxX/SURF4 family)